MQRARFWILCAMGALVVISGILLFGARYWAVNSRSLKNMLPADVDMRLDNLILNEVGAGDRTMSIKAVTAQYFKTKDLFVLEKVRATILTDKARYQIDADSGNYDQGQKVVDLSGNVKVADQDGGILLTEALTMKFNEGLLISEEPFCYTAPSFDLNGRSFVYRTNEKFLEVDGRVHFLYQ